jgi:predicted DNA-binding transcriptional regulator AlpA
MQNEVEDRADAGKADMSGQTVEDAEADAPKGKRGGPLPLARLGDLGEDTIIDEAHLAALFGRCRASVKRFVERGELPQPTKLGGQNIWTARALIQHIEKRLAAEARDAERLARKIS